MNVAHLHEREAERVPAAPQQSLTLCHRFVIQSNAIYLGSRERETLEIRTGPSALRQCTVVFLIFLQGPCVMRIYLLPHRTSVNTCR